MRQNTAIARAFRMTPTGTEMLWRGNFCGQGLVHKGYIFTGNECVSMKTGDILWRDKLVCSPNLVADGKIFVLSDDGVLTVLRASTREYSPLAQAKVLPGVDAWGPMALVQGRLLLRDSHRLACLDLRAR